MRNEKKVRKFKPIDKNKFFYNKKIAICLIGFLTFIAIPIITGLIINIVEISFLLWIIFIPSTIFSLIYLVNYKYFNNEVDHSWLREKVQEAIVSVGPRYSKELSIDVPISKIFDILTRNDNFKNKINLLIWKLDYSLNLYRQNPVFYNNENFDQLNNDNYIGRLTEPYNQFNHLLEDSRPTNENFLNHIDKIRRALLQLRNNSHRRIDFDKIVTYCEFCLTLVKTYDYELRTNRRLEPVLEKFNDFFDEILSDIFYGKTGLLQKSHLLIVGNAGVGKTHLFCDIAENRLNKNLPTILLLGEQFRNTEPWEQIQRILGLNYPLEELLEKLNKYGKKTRSNSLILIDGLNEGEGNKLWSDFLSKFLYKIEKYENIAIALSIRSDYENTVIPTHLDIPRIKHQGFGEMNPRTLKKYFGYYDINPPNFPLLYPEFKNPLFLKTLCETLQLKGEKDFPKGHQNILAIFDDFLEYLYKEKLCKPKYLNSDRNRNLLKIAVRKLASKMAENDSKSLEYEFTKEILDNILPNRGFSKSLLKYMLSEGILSKYPRFENDTEELWIRFTYERFTDIYIAKTLLEEKTTKEIVVTLGNYDFGVIEAISIILGEEHNEELITLLRDEDLMTVEYLSVYIRSLMWRNPDTITDSTKESLQEEISTIAESTGRDYIFLDNIYQSYYGLLLQVCIMPDHPLNAVYLDSFLEKFSVCSRDYYWTRLISRRSEIFTLLMNMVNWLRNTENLDLLSDDSIGLFGITLGWAFTSSNQELRDNATKALVSLYCKYPQNLDFFFNKFREVNDLYVLERVVAVLYGSLLRNRNSKIGSLIGKKIYDWMFEEKKLPLHLLIRDYCKQIVMLSQYLDSNLEINEFLISPPYNSDISLLEISNDKREDLDDFKTQDDYSSISFSIFQWDFGRYIIGTNSNKFPWSSRLLISETESNELTDSENFDLELFQYWIFNKVLELGWKPECFKKYDEKVKKGVGMYRAERIGKKYQMIAYYMLTALVSDHYEFISEFEPHPRRVGTYYGPWQVMHGRDIDPSLLLYFQDEMTNSTEITGWGWCPFLKNKWKTHMKNQNWITSFRDIHDYKDLIQLEDKNNKKWLALEGYYVWREPRILSMTKWRIPQKQMWTKLYSYLVKEDDFEELIYKLKDCDFMGDWIPVLDSPQSVYLGEYYWGEPYTQTYEEWFGRYDWIIPNYDVSPKIKVLPTTDNYYRTTAWRDDSYEFPINFILLHRLLKKELGLSFDLVHHSLNLVYF